MILPHEVSSKVCSWRNHKRPIRLDRTRKIHQPDLRTLEWVKIPIIWIMPAVVVGNYTAMHTNRVRAKESPGNCRLSRARRIGLVDRRSHLATHRTVRTHRKHRNHCRTEPHCSKRERIARRTRPNDLLCI